jgi:hypothetical protein
MARPKTRKREVVELRAFNAHGELVETAELSLEEYYQGLHDLIDKDAYRAARGITAIEGRIVGPSGKVDQEFQNGYSTEGAYDGGRRVHADGTVDED